MEVDNDALDFKCSERETLSAVTEKETEVSISTTSDVRKTKPVLHAESNKSQEMDVEIIDVVQITAGSKQFTSETLSAVTEKETEVSLSTASDVRKTRPVLHAESNKSQEMDVEIIDVVQITAGSKQFTSETLGTLTEKETEVSLSTGSYVRKTRPALHAESNKSQGMDVVKITAGSKQSTSETGSTASEHFIAESLILVSDNTSSGCQDALRHFVVEGSSSDPSDIQQRNVKILTMNDSELKFSNALPRRYIKSTTANRIKINFLSEELEGCKTTNTTSTDPRVIFRHPSESVDCIKKVVSDSELSTEGYWQCSLCWKWCRSENLLKRHILWHFFIKNSSEGRHSGITCASNIIQEKSLEELIRRFELEFRNSQDTLCWNCHRNYEIHFTSRSPVISESEPLKCPVCLNAFRCKISLQIHMKDHLCTTPYACCICKMYYKTASSLITHMNAHKYSAFSDVYNTSQNIYPSGSADESNLEIARSLKSKEEDPSVINRHFGSESSIEEEDLFHSIPSEVKTVNLCFVSDFTRNFENGKELASCNSAYELANEMISCMKVDRYVKNAVDFLNDEGTAMITVIQKLEYCIKLAEGMRDISETQSYHTHSTLEDLSELEVVFKTVMLTSYGNLLADLDRSQFWCKICATPFQESAKFQIHKIKFCTGRKNKRSLKRLKDKSGEWFQHKCFMCNRYFSNRLKRYDHMVFHFAFLLKRCPVCTKHFKSPSLFTDHLLTHPHMENNLLKCSDCNKYFCDEEAIAKHFQRVHRVRRPYKCETCDREFFKGSSFALHVKGHLKNKWRKSLVGMDMYKPPKQNLQK